MDPREVVAGLGQVPFWDEPLELENEPLERRFLRPCIFHNKNHSLDRSLRKDRRQRTTLRVKSGSDAPFPSPPECTRVFARGTR